MKFKSIILSAVLLAGFPLFAADEAKADAPVTAVKESPKDALLTFLLDKAKTYSGTIEEGVTKAVDFAKEQTPIVVKEFLTWRAYEHGIKAFVFPSIWLFIILPLGLVAICKGDDNGWTVTWAICAVFSFVFISAFPFFVSNAMSFVQIQVAPRIYLIEEVSKMIK